MSGGDVDSAGVAWARLRAVRPGTSAAMWWTRERMGWMVGAVGLEPTISCSQSMCLATRPHPDGVNVSIAE